MTPHDVAFPTLSEHQIGTLSKYAKRRHFHHDEPLFTAGLSTATFFVVLSGAVEILDHSGDTPKTVVVHEPGEFTGDIDILTRRVSIVSAVARGETEVLEVAPADIRRIIAEDPQMGDIILHAFIARREQLIESGFKGVRVIGSRNSRDTYRIREFLSRNQVPVTWVDVDTDSGAAELLNHFDVGDEALPVVLCAGQPLLRNPSTLDLAQAVGLKRPIGTEVFDLVIVGAGPAGLAAAVYGASEGLSTLLLDADSPGGQAGASNAIENYLGFPTGITGANLTRAATLQAQKFGARLSMPAPATALEDDGSHLTVRLSDGEGAFARCVLIATGADYRKLDVPELDRFEGLGVYYVATKTELDACGDSEVVIVGAGNSAGQAAVYLAQHTQHVTILVRRDNMRQTMSSYLIDRIEATPNVEVLYTTQVRELHGDARLERIAVENTTTGELRTIETAALFTLIGAVPRTDWLPGQIDTDPKGFVCTGRQLANARGWTRKRQPFLLETSQAGVFAAGDVRLGSAKRVAAAVGEGAMAVMFVHEYLAELRDDPQPEATTNVSVEGRAR